jgi:glycosyltransferase involved in cell wall biosynthesis
MVQLQKKKSKGSPETSVKVSIIIPAHNEEENIGGLLERLKKVTEDDWEIIVVNDCSEDNTMDICHKSGVRVISHPYRMGNGASIKTGMRNARGDILVMMDGDAQHKPEDIPRLLDAMDNYDMVVGSRSWGSQSDWSRGLANKIYNVFASYVTSRKIPDLTSGFRAVKRDVVKRYIYMLPNSFSYPTTLTLAFIKSGLGVNHIPIETEKRGGESKIKPLKDGVRFILIIARIATIFSPFRVFLPLSLLLFVVGVIYYLYWFVVAHRFTNMALLLILMSVIVFLLGLVSEQISQLRFERTED